MLKRSSVKVPVLSSVSVPIGFVLMAFFLTANVNSQGVDTSNFDLNDPDVLRTTRIVYDKSPNLPDSVAFLTRISSLYYLNSMSRETAIHWIAGEMGLSVPESTEFLDDLLDTYAAINTDYDEFTLSFACDTNKPRAAGTDIYPVLEAMDDARADLARVRYEQLMAGLNTDKAARFLQWLEASKADITHVVVRHKEHYERIGANPNEALATICDGANSRQGGNSQ